ncbi:MAG TPA: hypothetical protein PLF81_13840 [Candidatus Anammoximicrobium sp.]|nr:hypothetical protein [Candidatus Anammoximicrobium sp.]
MAETNSSGERSSQPGTCCSRRAFCAAGAGALVAVGVQGTLGGEEDVWTTARERAGIFADCGRNALRLLRGWIAEKQDPETGLFSRGGTWDYHNEAADHYSSLVLVAHYVDPSLIQEGAPLHRTMVRCRELCALPSGLPVTYDLTTRQRGKPATFTALAEWLRDGLIRIVEVLGTENVWYREMERLVDAMLAASGGPHKLRDALSGGEARGNMLQTLTRLHAISGRESYLGAAESLFEAVLADAEKSADALTFDDHGSEWVPGLGELFALQCQLRRPQAETYREPLRRLLDKILAQGAHPVSGLFCPARPSQGGGRQWKQPPDTWGYVLFTYENYDRATGENRYGAAIEKPVQWLVANRQNYAALRETLWPRSVSSDDWSDSYESMIVLWNRDRHVAGVFAWLDWATQQHTHRRHPDRPYGPFTGGHFDGSTGRTLVMHMMLASQGVRCAPFTEGLRLGGVMQGESLRLFLESDPPWRGKLICDGPRCEYPTGRLDWARLNEMPQWFVARPERNYVVTIDDESPQRIDGAALIAGLEIACPPEAARRISIRADD